MTAAIAIAISAVTVIIGAALTEELYFRGLLYGQLAARYGAAAAIAGSAGIFGLAHFQPDAFPTLFALGLILAFLRLRTASFWPGFALHAINNAAAFSVALLA
jgi:membrane protease YdiL (CAAX protease family)